MASLTLRGGRMAWRARHGEGASWHDELGMERGPHGTASLALEEGTDGAGRGPDDDRRPDGVGKRAGRCGEGASLHGELGTGRGPHGTASSALEEGTDGAGRGPDDEGSPGGVGKRAGRRGEGTGWRGEEGWTARGGGLDGTRRCPDDAGRWLNGEGRPDDTRRGPDGAGRRAGQRGEEGLIVRREGRMMQGGGPDDKGEGLDGMGRWPDDAGRWLNGEGWLDDAGKGLDGVGRRAGQ